VNRLIPLSFMVEGQAWHKECVVFFPFLIFVRECAGAFPYHVPEVREVSRLAFEGCILLCILTIRVFLTVAFALNILDIFCLCTVCVGVRFRSDGEVECVWLAEETARERALGYGK
jgi:hypothetical protein